MDAKREIESLREQLRHHNEKYYNEDAPEISDYEYDMLQRKLRYGKCQVFQGAARVSAGEPAGRILF